MPDTPETRTATPTPRTRAHAVRTVDAMNEHAEWCPVVLRPGGAGGHRGRGVREFRILQGDALAVPRTLEPNSFDACLCDPPYGLSFMGRAWDHGVPSTETWAALLRVLKPGAILLAFGGTRTHHRLMVAIEDAGFEVRDCCMWLYASGFPKSLDISRVIDKAAGVTREVVGLLPNPSSTRNRQTMGRQEHSGSGFQENPVLTAPATDAARRWDGYGTALRPAWERIIVAMKPCGNACAERAQVGRGGVGD
jgi:hypothetical protein